MLQECDEVVFPLGGYGDATAPVVGIHSVVRVQTARFDLAPALMLRSFALSVLFVHVPNIGTSLRMSREFVHILKSL